VTAIALAVGAVAILSTASVACKMRRAWAAPGAFPPSPRLDVMALAPRQPATSHGPATRWRLDALVAALGQPRPWTMSRASVWRILAAADLKPPRSVYGLHSHDPDFEVTAHDICALDINALRVFEQGRVVLCSDEKTGMQILARTYPTQPMAPGKPEKCAHADIRPGTRALMASFVVATGQVVGNLGQTRTSIAFATPLAHVVKQLPARPRYDWGGGESQHPLEPGRLPCGCAVVQGALGGQGLAPWWAAPSIPERPPPYACLPLYAPTGFLAQPGRVGG
jgi:hypothetical protein